MEKTFDYVIVGAGSSGCVMANRLSENGKNTVLILEAGGKDNNSVSYTHLTLPTNLSV